MAASLEWLEANSTRIDRLNVFPVPDGDTGTNMVLTMRAAVEQAARLESPTVAEVGRGLARGALLGARGNSGVILSQILRGMSEGLAKFAQCSPAELAQGIKHASRAADESVTNPVEGTILTVARDAAKAAVSNTVDTLEDLGTTVVEAARTSVQRTPEQLAVLKEAGVVDAGGQGLLVIYEGLLRNLRGLPPPEIVAEDRGVEVFSEFAAAHGADEHGYCTEFVILGEDMDPDVVRDTMGEYGGSLLVVGDPTLIRVHMHTETPGEVLTAAMSYGPLDAVKAENMDMQQAENFATAATEASAATVARVPVVATATGEGLTASVREPRRHCRRGRGQHEPERGRHPAGRRWPRRRLGGCLAQQQEHRDGRAPGGRAVRQRCASRRHADGARGSGRDGGVQRHGCGGCERTHDGDGGGRHHHAGDHSGRARRHDRRLDHQAGDYLGLQDDELVTTGEAPNDLVKRMVEGLADDEPELATIYYGSQVASETVEQLSNDLEASFPDLEVEVIAGGQELYDYVISVE